ncbi:hypothetical protein F511_36430 [Dorcoceras hygrometricum]|uniref:Uncharacterized protein n=1 Tax=Dorcoceras hygrometricum TaxID=472368 RepID=A0A2Z7AC23_9LAMI|nr:hypothetical protein F511_36430 [Dorcoceras hygrometricum]
MNWELRAPPARSYFSISTSSSKQSARRDMYSRSTSSSSKVFKRGIGRKVSARGVQRYHSRYSRSCLSSAIREDKLGYLKLLQMGNTDPNNKAGKEIRVVGREKLATGFPNDWMRSNSWFIVAHACEYCCYLLVSLERSTCWFCHRKPSTESYEGKTLSYQLFQTTSFCCRYLQGAPADLSSSAEHDVVTNDIIIDGPLRCSSWLPFEVPAGSSFLYRLQLVLIVPADSLCSSWFNLASA